MKKIMIVAALIIAGMSFTACNSNEKACWEVKVVSTMEFMGESESFTTVNYVYGTESEAEAMAKQLQNTTINMPGATVKYNVDLKKVDKAESDCLGVSIDM